MEVIAKNKEGYISFSVDVTVDKYVHKEGNEKEKLIELRFTDSFTFLSSSLDSLTKNFVSGGKQLFRFEDYSELQYDLLTRKGIYPYEYISSWDRFEETQLPPIETFYSKLNMSSINSNDYQHAQRVWEEFGIQNLGDYHNLYLRTDVVLLANVYEAFRETCLEPRCQRWTLFDEVIFLSLPHPRAISVRGHIFVIAPSQSHICSVDAMQRFLCHRQATIGPLFLFKDGTFLTRSHLNMLLSDWMVPLNLVHTRISSHSFRIGAAAAGSPAWLIQALGRWSSQCYTQYIRMFPAIMASVPNKLVNVHTVKSKWSPELYVACNYITRLKSNSEV